MSNRYEVPEGSTAPLDFQLRNVTRDPDTGIETESEFDATGMTVAIVVRDRTNALVPTITVAWLVIAESKVRVSFQAASLVASLGPYTFRFEVTDGAGKIHKYPMSVDPDFFDVGFAA